MFLDAQIEGEIPSVIFFKQRLATYLRSDMEAEDDNSEARDIVTVERELVYARQCNRFQRDDMELRQSCAQRRDQAAYIYQQERVHVEPSAPPMPDGYEQVIYNTTNNIQYTTFLTLHFGYSCHSHRHQCLSTVHPTTTCTPPAHTIYQTTQYCLSRLTR